MTIVRGASTAAAVAAALALGPAVGGAQVLEEIVVTAQKREQSLQDVGVAVTAFSAEQLGALGVQSSVEVARVTPGVHVSGSIGGQNSQFTIRGVTQADFADTLEAPVAVYVDDSYISMQQAQLFGLFDLARVEVLKGPQGTLFGRNATGGLVHFITERPTEEFEGYVDATYGSYDQQRLEAAISGPLTDRVSGRLSVLYDRHDEILDNQFPNGTELWNLGEDFWNEDTVAGRAQLMFRLSDSADVLLSVFGGKIDQGIAPYQQGAVIPVFDAQGRQINTIFAAADDARIAIGPGGINVDMTGTPTAATRPVPGGDLFGYVDPDGEDFDTSDNYGSDDGNTFETRGATARLRWDNGIGTLTSITDFKNFEKDNFNDPDAGPVDQFGFFSVAELNQFSQEIRLDGASERLQWVTGVYYLYIDADVPRESIFVSPESILNAPLGGGGAPLDLRDIATKETNSLSLFGQLDYQLSPRLNLIAGARVIQERQDYDYRTGIFLGATDTLLVPGRTFRDDFDEILWAAKLQLEYRPRDAWLLYAGINRGVKAGAFNQPLFINGLPDSEIPYDEETLIAYEVGFKSTLLGGSTRFNGALYYYDYKDYQVFEIRVADNVVRNADATNLGAEFELTTQPTQYLTLSLSVAAFDAEVKDLSLNGIVRTVEPTYAPDLQAILSATYEWPFLGGKLALHGDVSYTDSFFYQIFNFDAQNVDSYAVGNLQLSYRSPNETWELTAFVENVTDERYLTIGVDLSTLCGCAQNAYGKPRWYGASVRYRF